MPATTTARGAAQVWTGLPPARLWDMTGRVALQQLCRASRDLCELEVGLVLLVRWTAKRQHLPRRVRPPLGVVRPHLDPRHMPQHEGGGMARLLSEHVHRLLEPVHLAKERGGRFILCAQRATPHRKSVPEAL